MAEDRLQELFKLAMWDEHISHSLYLATAGKRKDRKMKTKLLALAGDEKAHLEELGRMHRVLCSREENELTKVGFRIPRNRDF